MSLFQKKRVIKLLFIFFSLVLVLSFGVFFYTWHRLHDKLRVHVQTNNETPSTYKLTYETRYFFTEDGIKIASWYIPAENAKAVVILLNGFQRKDGGRSLMLPHAQYLHDAGYTTLLIDFRSMGDTPGNKVTLGVHEWKDAKAAHTYVTSLPENKSKKVGFFGNSMGAATAIIVAGMGGEGDFVIASVPYASFKQLFHAQLEKENRWTPLFLPQLRLAAVFELGPHYEYYTPITWIKYVHVPILLIEASQDKTIHSIDAKQLFDEANHPKAYWQADTSHDIFEKDKKNFQKQVLQFLQKLVT